jgi:hypothetical protein
MEENRRGPSITEDQIIMYLYVFKKFNLMVKSGVSKLLDKAL